MNSVKMISFTLTPLYFSESDKISYQISFQQFKQSNFNLHLEKKLPRLKGRILLRPCKTRGISLPNFLYYYWSANIRAILYLLEKDTTASWVIMETASIPCAKLLLSQSLSNNKSSCKVYC